MSAIGFVGTGIMGRPMAINLINAGYKLNIYARNPDKIRDLEGKGAVLFKSIREMAADSPQIITMLPDSPDSEEVITGGTGIIMGAKMGSFVIDMSSINPIVSIKMGKALRDKGIDFMDAPVSGGEEGAVKGELAIMAGGEKRLFRKAEPVFKILGSSYTHVGGAGAGNFTKLVNQIIVALNIAAMGEAFVLAEKAGLSLGTVYNAIKGGLAGSNVLDSKTPRVLRRDFEPGFRIALHYKDIKNALSAADSLGVSLPLTSLMGEVLKSLKTGNYSDFDHGAIIKFFERISNMEV